MSEKLRNAYREALGALGSLAHVARTMGVPYRTLQNRKLGNRGVTTRAALELVRHLRSRSGALAAAADRLEAAATVDQEEESRG